MGSFSSDEAGKSDRTQELTWALMDELITDAEMSELEEMLRTDKSARDGYVRCMQLHADLATHFAPPSDSQSAGKQLTPILGFLGTDASLTGLESPKSDTAR